MLSKISRIARILNSIGIGCYIVGNENGWWDTAQRRSPGLLSLQTGVKLVEYLYYIIFKKNAIR